MMIPPIFWDLCTAVGAIAIGLNVALLAWWAVRCAALAWHDWRNSSGPARPSGEVRAVPGSNHPAVVPGGLAAGTAQRRPHLRAVPARRSEGGAA